MKQADRPFMHDGGDRDGEAEYERRSKQLRHMLYAHYAHGSAR